MNALNRHIESGERLVVSKETMKPEFQKLENRIFIAESGFGLEAFTSGSHISGRFEIDGESTNIRGNEISVDETREVQRYKRSISLREVVSFIEDEFISQDPKTIRGARKAGLCTCPEFIGEDPNCKIHPRKG